MIGADSFLTAAAFCTVVIGAVFLRPRPARRAPVAGRPVADRVRPTSLLRRTAVTTIALVLIATVAGVFAAAIVAMATTMRPRLVERREHRRRSAAITNGFPDFVDLLVLTIRSGCTPVQAFRSLTTACPVPVRSAVVAVVRRVDAGERFADAISALPHDLGVIAQPLSDALALADRHGTPLAPTLDRLADESRAQRRRNADVAARQLPIRLSFPLVGCTLPSFVLLTIVPLMAGTLSSLPGLRP